MKDQKMINTFIDSVNAVYHELKRKKYQNISHQLAELADICAKNPRMNINNFSIVGHLAKGAYGEVFVARKNGEVYAIKRIFKDTIVQQPFNALFMSEKELMVDARNSEWLLYVHYTFQDEDAVYFVMDFLPGGDFMGYLVRKESVSEDEIRFYGAEIVSALEELHALGYIHRDLKPENLLIEKSGHIKMADFGSCIKTVGGRVMSCSTVGTPDYVSPDVLSGTGTEVEYGYEVDLWTLGVVLYEMLYEAPPFYSETLQETYEKITNIDFKFPEGGSCEFRSLVSKLLCRKEDRLTIEEIKSHDFFGGIDWKNLKSVRPPFVPELEGEVDLSHFERPENSGSTMAESEARGSGEVHFLNFVGFTFDPEYSKAFASRIESTVKEVCNGRLLPEIKKSLVESRKPPVISETTVFVDKYTSPLICAGEVAAKTSFFERQRITKSQETAVEGASVLPAGHVLKAATKREAARQKAAITDQAGEISKFLEQRLGLGRRLHVLIRHTGELNDMLVDLKTVTRNLRLDFEEARSQNSSLINSLNLVSLENKVLREKEKGSKVHLYKKELRVKKTEVREFQQKLEGEITTKNRMVDEIIFLKKEVERLSRKRSVVERSVKFRVKVIGNSGAVSTEMHIDGQEFKLLDHESNINNVFIKPLKSNEMFHMSYRERSLTLCVVVIQEVSWNTTPNLRTNLKVLEDAIKKEENIQSGIEKIMKISSGGVVEDAKTQLEGSRKRLVYLKKELERGKRSTDVIYEDYDENEHRYEYNNHTFATKTFPPQTLCEHCNDVLRGIMDQGLECYGCKMVVHRNCYVLTDISCEMYYAMSKGSRYYVMMRSIEDKERLVRWTKG